jgi:hypothetical protein
VCERPKQRDGSGLLKSVKICHTRHDLAAALAEGAFWMRLPQSAHAGPDLDSGSLT